MVLDQLDVPIILAPLAGGPSTPGPVRRGLRGGCLGFLAAGYLTAEAMHEQLQALRALTSRPFGVTSSCRPAPADPATYGPYVEEVRTEGAAVGEPAFRR